MELDCDDLESVDSGPARAVSEGHAAPDRCCYQVTWDRCDNN